MGIRTDKIKKRGKENLYMSLGLLIMLLANHFYGVYAWLMGGLAIFHKIGFMDVTASQYTSISLLALACLILIKSGTFAKKEESKKFAKTSKKAQAQINALQKQGKIYKR